MVLRSCRSICQTYMKANILPDLFKNLMKPNFTPPASRKLHSKSVGFHSVSDGCGVLGTVVVSMIFMVLVASVQPNLRCYSVRSRAIHRTSQGAMNCATTNRTTFEKCTSFQGLSVGNVASTARSYMKSGHHFRINILPVALKSPAVKV